MKRTPLHDDHVERGARMVEFAGWEMPVHYGSIVEEHMQVRTKVGLFDVSHMGEIELSGPGAEASLMRLLANDASRLRRGRAHYSLIVNERGGVVDDVIVYRLEAERFLICVNAANADKDLAWISAGAGEQCRVDDRSSDYALIAVQGPRAIELVTRLVPEAAELGRFGCAICTMGTSRVVLARTGYTGEDGFEAFVAAPEALALWRLLLEEGRPEGAAPIGLGARDTLRLEAGLPLYGHELDENISPFEAGLSWVVKLNRPSMVGYDALQVSAAAPARELVGLEVSGGIARHGCSVLASERKIGMVTSGSYCPAVSKAVALALLDADSARSDLAVDVRGKARPARVTSVPFYVRGRTSDERGRMRSRHGVS